MIKKVNVLGTVYSIFNKKYDEDEAFDQRSIGGYCNGYTHEIVVCDMRTYKGWDHEDDATCKAAENKNIRHEITHAFFYESGLADNCLQYDGPWPHNEELIDWIAEQGPKIYAAWKEADCLD